MKNIISAIILVISYFTFTSCDESTSSKDTGSGASHEEATDYVWDASKVVNITLNGTSISVDSTGATVNGSTVTITAAGTYSISGTLSNGKIIVDTQDKGIVQLIMNNVTISNTSTSPLFIESSVKTVIILPENSVNTFSDASSYTYSGTDTEPNAAIYSKSDLSIYGNGLLTVKGNAYDGITSKDGLVIAGGNINVTAVDDGIRGKDYLIVDDGTINVVAGGDGLKSDNDANTAKGYISIKSGTITINSTGDAISAYTKVNIAGGKFSLTSGGGSSRTVSASSSAKGVKGLVGVTILADSMTINAADDGIHSNGDIVINDGVFSIASADDGIHADVSILINKGKVSVTKSIEGIESHKITVKAGEINVLSSDDSFNASNGNGGESNDGSCIYINGGIISLNATGGDALDSNGSIVMTAGTVVIQGPKSQPEVSIDYNGTFNISGGLLVASGINSNMTQATSNSSSQYCLKLTFRTAVAASTLIHIQDSNGTGLVTFKPVRSINSLIFSSPALKSSSAYSIYTGGSSTGTVSNGYYSDGVYTGGTLKSTITVASKVSSATVN